MRLRAQPFLWKWVLFAWEWKMISISKAVHLPSFWNRGPGELVNGLLTLRLLLPFLDSYWHHKASGNQVCCRGEVTSSCSKYWSPKWRTKGQTWFVKCPLFSCVCQFQFVGCGQGAKSKSWIWGVEHWWRELYGLPLNEGRAFKTLSLQRFVITHNHFKNKSLSWSCYWIDRRC